jgi:hypothetical protein
MSAGGGETAAAAGGGGMDWSKMLKGLGGLDDSKDTKKPAVPQMQSAAAGQSQSQLGTPRAPVSMDQLVKLLIEHAAQYQQAAMTPGGAVGQQQRPAGLLGY